MTNDDLEMMTNDDLEMMTNDDLEMMTNDDLEMMTNDDLEMMTNDDLEMMTNDDMGRPFGWTSFLKVSKGKLLTLQFSWIPNKNDNLKFKIVTI